MYQIVLIQTEFQSSDRVEVDFWGSVIKNALKLKSRGTKNIELPSQGTYNFQILGHEILIIADHKYAKNFWLQECKKFAMLDIEL